MKTPKASRSFRWGAGENDLLGAVQRRAAELNLTLENDTGAIRVALAVAAEASDDAWAGGELAALRVRERGAAKPHKSVRWGAGEVELLAAVVRRAGALPIPIALENDTDAIRMSLAVAAEADDGAWTRAELAALRARP
jgi:hypothetical protein